MYTIKKQLLLFLQISIIVGIFSGSAISQYQPADVGDVFPSWNEGYLDIHHINTARGDAAFFMLPDGTTKIIDAGDKPRSPGPRYVEAKPDDSRTPGEWISRYITNMITEPQDVRLDYALLTHFHSDHMGGVHANARESKSGSYKLSGITEVGELIPIGTIIDRAWPDYDWPRPLESNSMQNYRKFLEWQSENKGLKVEQFQVGRNDQIELVNKPDNYPEFEIRNIAANGDIWTGVHNNVRHHFPLLEKLSSEDYPTENMCSIVLRLSYGSFNYFTGGDLVGIPMPPGSPSWQDMETPVGKVVGPVDIHVLNHHGAGDASNSSFLRSLRPRIHIAQTWGITHLTPATLQRLYSTSLYSGERDVFTINTANLSKNYIGSRMERLKSLQGHVVVRVIPGGDEYYIYILDDSEESFEIKAVHGPYESR